MESTFLKRLRRSLFFQWIALFLPPFLMIVGIAAYYYQDEKAKAVLTVAAHESAAVEIGNTSIQRSLETVKGDLNYLSRYHDFKRFMNDSSGRQYHFADDYKLVMESRRTYDQIRWIDEKGMERVRVDFKNGFPVRVPEEQLQNKRDRYYFTDAMKLPAGTIYFSPFDLNVEHGKIETPYKPMIRIATPITDAHGEKRGIFILNYLGSELIHKFVMSTAFSNGNVMLVNEEGYWLKGVKREEEWGFLFNRNDLTLAKRYPAAWQKIVNAQQGQFQDEEGLWTFQTVYPLAGIQDGNAVSGINRGLRQPYFWKAVTFVPCTKLYESSREQLYFILFISLLTLAGAGAGSWGLAYAYRKKQEAVRALAELQNKTEGVLLSIPDIIMQVDKDKRYIWANAQGIAFFGEDVVGHEAAFYFEGEQDTYTVVHPMLMGEIDAVYVESWQRRQDGERRLLAWWCRSLKDTEGNVVGALSTARDITEEYQREEALLMQTHIFDAVQDSIMVHDLEGRFIYLNDNAWRTRGYTHDEMMQMRVEELDASEYTSGHPEMMKAALDQMREQGAMKIEVEHVCKNQERLPVEVYAKLITLHEKEYVLSSVRDISDRKKTQRALEESEKKYRDLVEHSMIGVYRSDLSGAIRYVNPALAAMLAYDSPEDMIGQNSVMHFKNPDERARLVQRLNVERHIGSYELELLNRYDMPVSVMISATLEGELISGMIIDMSEIKQSRQEVEKLSKAVEQIDDIVYITDKFGNITYVNGAYCRHMGYTREEAIGQNSRISKSGMHDREFYKNLWTTILSGEVYRNTLINRKKNGDLYYEKKTITPLKDDEHRIIGFVSTGKDVTEETMLHQEIERMAMIDKLTGIYNRHKFEEFFVLESERSRRFALPLSMLLIDIDHFKSVNDTYGHDAGDEVLKGLALVIQTNIRKIDIFARWGGEEFLVLSPGTDQENIQELAEKLRKAVEDAVFPEVGRITISLGVSTFKQEDSFIEFFKRVDGGLYAAKENGRNRVGFVA